MVFTIEKAPRQPNPYIETPVMQIDQTGMGNNGYRTSLMGRPEIDSTFTRWQNDTDDILQNLEFELKGFEKVGENWKILENHDGRFDERYPDALMNNSGTKDFLRICRMNFNKIVNSSNFDDKEVHRLALDFEKYVIQILRNHYRQYGIKKPEDLDVIFVLVVNPYYAMLKQSFQNGTRVYLGGIMKYGESFENVDRDSGMGMSRPRGLKNGFGLFG